MVHNAQGAAVIPNALGEWSSARGPWTAREEDLGAARAMPCVHARRQQPPESSEEVALPGDARLAGECAEQHAA